VGIVAFTAIANPGEPITLAVCALYSVQLIFQALEQIQYWFHAKLLSKYASVTMLVAYVVTSGYKILLLATGSSVYWFALSQALEFLLISASLLGIYKRLGAAKLRFSWKLFRSMFSRSKYYIVSNLMISIFAQTDRVMLKMMLDETAVGYYSAAVTCAGIGGFVFSAIINSAQPVILECARKSVASMEKAVTTLYSVIIYLSLGQCVVITLFAEQIIGILYGAEYGPAVNALRLIVWYSAFAHIGSVRNVWILVQWMQKYLIWINFLGAATNVVLNLVLIPSMGINGAALAS
jgi:O-antigen/teichoic acid export membrane protein